MKTKQPSKGGYRIDIADMVRNRHTVDSDSCRTNKHVNTFITSNNDISNIECATNTISQDSASIAHAMCAVATTVVCDGLNLTRHLDNVEQKNLKIRLEKYSGQLKFKNAQKMMPYRQGRNIYDGDAVLGQIRFDPFGDRAGYFFLHVNPAKMDAGQSQMIQGLVSYLLGEPWCSFVGRARVSLLDAAVDVHGVNIASIIPVPSRAKQSGFFLKFFQKGQTRLYKQGTEYVGHNKSEKHACIYNKADEQSELIGVSGEKNITRIELQAKPRVRGKFGEELSTLADLPRYANPFGIVDIAEFPKEAEKDDLLMIATALTAYVGSTAVLGMVRDKPLKQRLKDHLMAQPCRWWQPEKHWADFLKGLAGHPLFACCHLMRELAYVHFFLNGKHEA